MKKKKTTILRGALTLALVVGLFGFAISAAASPGEDEWDTLTYPDDGSLSDWFRSDNITGGPGPIAMAIDGTLYLYTQDDGEDHLFNSDDGGRTWSKTDYEYDVTGGPIVAIAPSSIDADVVYVADAGYVYKTDDAGDVFSAVADATMPALGADNITCLAVGYTADDEPYLFFGTAESAGLGGVWYIAEEAYGAAWVDLEVGGAAAGSVYNVYGLGCSPDFASDSLVVAVSVNSSSDVTVVTSNDGVVGEWAEVALLDDNSANFTITEASDIAFPADFDFDDAYEFFVGVVGPAHATAPVGGGVYLIYDEDYHDLLDDVSDNISSLYLVGNVGSAMLMAGVYDAADVWYSTDDGAEWESALAEGKRPSGDGPTWVVMDEDFADSETAWAAAEGPTTNEGAVSLTGDGGLSWNQVSMISTDLDSVESLSFSTGYRTDETLFMVTQDTGGAADNLFRYDGENWERVADSDTLSASINMTQLSPAFPSDNTLFFTDINTGASPTIWRSDDGGQTWDDLRNQPDELATWLVIDDDTVVTGSNNELVWITTNHGSRAWDDYDVTDSGLIIMIAMSPNYASDETLILGDDEGQIFISEDAGEEWDLVEAAIDTGNTYVAFDRDYADNNIIYAASDDSAERCIIDPAEDWEDQEWEAFTDASLTSTSGIATAADGTLYISSSDNASGSQGVQRCLDPQEDDIDDSDFERVTTELDGPEELASLQLTRGSNILWSRNSESGATEEVWTYEDTLATAILLRSPSNNSVLDDDDEVTFKWAELGSADEYYIEWTDDPDWIENVDSANVTDPVHTVTDLDAGTIYYWEVMVNEGQPLRSRWSLEWTFTTALSEVAVPVHWTPENGAQDIVTSPSFGWTAVSGTDYYEFELANNPDFADATMAEPTINSMVSPMNLKYSTTYYWRVRAIADTTVISEWVSGAFTTMAEPVEPPAPAPAPAPAPPVTIPAAPAPITPAFIWAIVAIGAVLIIALIVLIIRTRRVA